MSRALAMQRRWKRQAAIRTTIEVAASISILASVLFMGLFGHMIF